MRTGLTAVNDSTMFPFPIAAKSIQAVWATFVSMVYQ
jgi:hypothetical protein